MIKAFFHLCVCLVLQAWDWLWSKPESKGHYSLSSEPGVKLEDQPHGVRPDSYYSLVHGDDHWEVVGIDEEKGMVALRSVRSLVNIYVSLASLEELFNLTSVFVPATFEQIGDNANGPKTP